MTWEEEYYSKIFKTEKKRFFNLHNIKVVALVLAVFLGVTALGVYAAQQYFGKVPGNVTVNSTNSLTITPNPISFTVANGTSAQQVIQIKNTAQVPLTLQGVSFSGTFPPSYFSESINDSGTVIQPGQTVNSLLTLSASPQTPPGSYSGTWNFTATG